MTVETKVNSNDTGLAFALESSLATLPGTPVWKPLAPNAFGDFGGDYKTKARNTINPDRQVNKGGIVGLDSKASFTIDFLPKTLQPLFSGFLFAAYRNKGEEAVTAVDVDSSNPDEYEVASTTGFHVGDLILGSGFTNAGNNTLNKVTAVVSNTSVEVADGTLTAEASPPSAAKIVAVGYEFGSGELKITTSGLTLPRLERASGTKDFTEFGLAAGEWIYIGGDAAGTKFATAACNGWARVRSIAATYLELDKTAGTIADDVGTSKTMQLFFGRFLKNELAASIVRSTYHIERTLGTPDDGEALAQSEYVIGAVGDELKINCPVEDLATVEMSFMGTGYQPYDQATGPKSGTRNSAIAEDAFNTASDIKRAKFATCSNSNSNVDPLFTYVGDTTITIKNGVKGIKAIGVTGSTELSTGNFEVSGEFSAQFQTISLLQARANNSDVTFDMVLARENQGVVIDVPLFGMSEGMAEVEKDEPIRVPIKADAATGYDVNSALNFTLGMTFFDYLPSVATA